MEILQINKIRKEFGTLVAVDDVSMSVAKGSIVGLIGPNGAGKTTLLKMLATLLRPSSGNATIFGHDLKYDYLKIRHHLAFLPDFFGLYRDLTLEECLEFFAKIYKVQPQLISQRVDNALKLIGLEEKKDSFVKHLSRGMVQRMGIGISLVHDPELLLLDEPASGLDPNQRIQLREILKKLTNEGKTTIISSHILTELDQLCSHIAIMNKGKIILYGTVDEIQQKVKNQKNIIISVLENCDKALAEIKNCFGFEIINVQGDTIIVQTNLSPDQIADLNSRLVNSGIKIVAFYQEKASLEDIFTKIC